jgi:hypothetical protein
LINWEQFPSQNPIFVFVFSQVTRAIPGLPWTQDWVNVFRGVDQFYLKTSENKRLFQAPRVFEMF